MGVPLNDVNGSIDEGSSEVFQKIGSNWTFVESLTGTYGEPGDQFGKSVAISGLTLIVGSPYNDISSSLSRGAVTLYEYNGTNWFYQRDFFQSEGDGDEYFGWSVCISGDYLLIGCKGDDIAGNTLSKIGAFLG